VEEVVEMVADDAVAGIADVKVRGRHGPYHYYCFSMQTKDRHTRATSGASMKAVCQMHALTPAHVGLA
jgi:hypothetical protein